MSSSIDKSSDIARIDALIHERDTKLFDKGGFESIDDAHAYRKAYHLAWGVYHRKVKVLRRMQAEGIRAVNAKQGHLLDLPGGLVELNKRIFAAAHSREAYITTYGTPG